MSGKNLLSGLLLSMGAAAAASSMAFPIRPVGEWEGLLDPPLTSSRHAPRKRKPADPAKKAARKRQKAARAKSRKK